MKHIEKMVYSVLVFLILLFHLKKTQAVQSLYFNSLGGNLDLFPTLISATAGEFGYSIQTWIALNQVKIRAVHAEITLPDKLSSKNFHGHRFQINAVILDYLFSQTHQGLWIGIGMEQWINSIQSTQSQEHISWTSNIATFGGGYIFPIGDHFYINLWSALHYNTSPQTIESAETKFKERQLNASFSIKTGIKFQL